MFEDNSEYEKLYNSLEKIDIKDVKPGSVCFVEYAGLGAMGSPGNFNILTEDCKLSENNYLKDKSVIDEIYRVIPDYENMRGEYVSSATKNDTWQILNMGMGNCLFVNKKIADDFYKSIKIFA